MTDPILTTRQRITVGLYGNGHTSNEIALVLGITRNTVIANLQSLRRKYTRAGRPTCTQVDFACRAEEDGINPKVVTS